MKTKTYIDSIKITHVFFEPLSKNEAKDKWTQEIYQIDDSPRYKGTVTWTHVDGISTWCNKADSPLPRRREQRGRQIGTARWLNQFKGMTTADQAELSKNVDGISEQSFQQIAWQLQLTIC